MDLAGWEGGGGRGRTAVPLFSRIFKKFFLPSSEWYYAIKCNQSFQKVLLKSVFLSLTVNFTLRGGGRVGEFGPLLVDFLDCYILNFMNCKINRIPFSYFIFRMTVTILDYCKPH